MSKTLPRYPIYVPSKGRAESGLTAKFLQRDGVPFYLVIERQEYDLYATKLGADNLLVLPFSNQGSVIPTRNWIKQHATAAGHERHWQLDDNIRLISRRYKTRRIPCNAGVALAATEDFVDRYENIAIAGLNYEMFLPSNGSNRVPPFHLNCRVYSCSLILNALPHEWRGRYNEDTDLCLQVLADGWCTALVNAFLIDKMRTMYVKGGNTAELYKGDGRLKMARALERQWPGVVTVGRRFHRPQHVVKHSWRRWDTPLRLKPGIRLEDFQPNEYGMKLVQVAPEIKSDALRTLMQDYNAATSNGGEA